MLCYTAYFLNIAQFIPCKTKAVNMFTDILFIHRHTSIYFKIHFLINSLIYPLPLFSSFMFCIEQHLYLIMKNNLYTFTYIKADKYISLENLMVFMLQKQVNP